MLFSENLGGETKIIMKVDAPPEEKNMVTPQGKNFPGINLTLHNIKALFQIMQKIIYKAKLIHKII